MIGHVVTMGYGIAGGMTGSANLLPTIGYGIGAPVVVVPPTVPGAEFCLTKERTHFALTRDRLHFSVGEE